MYVNHYCHQMHHIFLVYLNWVACIYTYGRSNLSCHDKIELVTCTCTRFNQIILCAFVIDDLLLLLFGVLLSLDGVF